MGAQYIARMTGVGSRGASHKIRDGWSYADISNARTGCGIQGPFSIEHLGSGRDLPVTCQRSGCKGA